MAWAAISDVNTGDVITAARANQHYANELYLKQNYLQANQYQTTAPADTAVTDQRMQSGHGTLVWPTSQTATALTITLATAFANTNYRVHMNQNLTGSPVTACGGLQAINMAVGSFQIYGYDPVAARNTSERIGWSAIGVV